MRLEIQEIGARGDGIAEHEGRRYFVPFTLPGETVEAEPRDKRGEGIAAELVEVLAPSRHREPPPCAHFKVCGGCALQHWRRDAYTAWKVDLIGRALAQLNVDAPRFEPPLIGAPGERRRADFVVPRDARAAELREQEAQVVTQRLERERLVRDGGVDAEAARVRAAEAGEHRHDLDRRRLRERRLDEPPPLAHAGQVHHLPRGADLHAERTVRRALGERIADDRLVGEPEHVVEVAARVLGIAARVRSAQAGDRAAAAIALADRVRELRRLAERADEQEVQPGRQLGGEILEPRVADQPHVVPGRLAPHA